MAEPQFNVSLLTPATDLVQGVDGVEFDLIFGRAGSDIFYGYDPIADNNANQNIDILFGDLFDNTPAEFEVTLAIAGDPNNGIPGNPFAILNANIPSVGKDRFVLGDEFQPYYSSFDPLSLLTTNQFGFKEFSVIYDFALGQDTIQLNGKKKDYALLEVNGLPVQGAEQFSGYALFSLQTGLPDLVSLIVQKPGVTLDLNDKNAFQFVGNKPKNKPQQKKIGQFGTTGLDLGYGVAADSQGNIYVTGSTTGSLNGTNTNKGSGDVWLTKFNSSGNQVLNQQFGSASGDTPYNVVTDKDGNFYLVGSTGGSLPDFRDAKQSPNGSDAWIAKYSSDGTLLWGRQIGEPLTGGFSTSGFGLQVDDSGNVYLSGLAIKDNVKGALDFPVEDDSWVIKFDSSGNQQWFTQIKDPQQPAGSPLLNTPFFDESYDMAVDKNGNSYLTGWTQGLVKESDPFNTDGTKRDLLKYDAWLSKVDANGQIQWTQQFGSIDSGLEFAWGVDTDSQGNIYVTGWTTGQIKEGNPSFGSYDVWLTKFKPDGTQEWAKQIGTKGDDAAFLSDIAIDASDNIFISGFTNDKLGSGTDDSSYNAWVGRFDTNGNNQWIQGLGIKGQADYATRLAVNNTGQVIVTGFTEGFLGASNNAAAEGAAVDAWVAQLDVAKGKLQKFISNAGATVISSETPAPIPTTDISSRLVTDDKLPAGDNVIDPSRGTPFVDYGPLFSSLTPAFDSDVQNSVPTALKTSGILDNNALNRTTKVDYKGTDSDNVYFGGSADDKLEARKGNDVLYGRGGNDEIKGEEGDDILYGGDGNDKIEGGDQNDVLYGEKGNDEVKGGKGSDVLTGVDPQSPLVGSGEIDKLRGEDQGDVFNLGDEYQAYYLGQGNSDYALIDDFKLDQSDKIQLYGSAVNSVNYRLETDLPNLPKGTAIFYQDDLIGIVKDVKGLTLPDPNVFSFVQQNPVV